jgi:hypothetical protein
MRMYVCICCIGARICTSTLTLSWGFARMRYRRKQHANQSKSAKIRFFLTPHRLKSAGFWQVKRNRKPLAYIVRSRRY